MGKTVGAPANGCDGSLPRSIDKCCLAAGSSVALSAALPRPRTQHPALSCRGCALPRGVWPKQHRNHQVRTWLDAPTSPRLGPPAVLPVAGSAGAAGHGGPGGRPVHTILPDWRQCTIDGTPSRAPRTGKGARPANPCTSAPACSTHTAPPPVPLPLFTPPPPLLLSMPACGAYCRRNAMSSHQVRSIKPRAHDQRLARCLLDLKSHPSVPQPHPAASLSCAHRRATGDGYGRVRAARPGALCNPSVSVGPCGSAQLPVRACDAHSCLATFSHPIGSPHQMHQETARADHGRPPQCPAAVSW